MELNLGRIGPYLSDRIVIVNDAGGGDCFFRLCHSLFDWLVRIISWIYSPAFYTDENRRTVACFKSYLIETLGEERLQRLCNRYSLDLVQKEKEGSPLLSRELAQILVGIQDVQATDIDALIQKTEWPFWVDPSLKLLLQSARCSEDLDAATFAWVREVLSKPFGELNLIPRITGRITGRPSQPLARIWFDPLLADRERLELTKENPTDHFETFAHNMAARVVKREMDVGMLVPAPNHPKGHAQFYRVSSKIITGEGMVSYILTPATRDTNLPAIRLYRGSAFRTGEIDGTSSLITDLESDLGRTAFESGQVYQPVLRDKTPYSVVIGHSLGSTIAQYELVRNDTIDSAYLYNGPGLPQGEVLAFNLRMKSATRPLKLIIRETHSDGISLLGQFHLGYQAPTPGVEIDYRRYYPRHVSQLHAHVTVWGREADYIGMEGGHSTLQLDQFFDRTSTGKECIRQTIGPYAAQLIRAMRDLGRNIFGSREVEQLGAQIGTYQQGKFHREHIRP